MHLGHPVNITLGRTVTRDTMTIHSMHADRDTLPGLASLALPRYAACSLGYAPNRSSG
jgi:hypothetical protein